MTNNSDAIFRPTFLACYEVSAKESFDVTCPPVTGSPVGHLGYLTFHISPTVPGRIAYTMGFQARSLVMRHWAL